MSGRILSGDALVAAIAAGARLVHLSEREREVARLRPNEAVVARTEEAAGRIKRLYGIRVEHAADRKL